jgi:hypothetical protein
MSESVDRFSIIISSPLKLIQHSWTFTISTVLDRIVEFALKLLATMEEEHRSFPGTGSAPTPLPHPSEEGLWNLTLSQFMNPIEKF